MCDCGLRYSAHNVPAPYYILVCGLSGSNTFPTLSHKTICYRKKCFRTRNGCSEFLYNFFRIFSQSYKNLAIYCNNSIWKDRCEWTCNAEIQVRIDNGVLPAGLSGTCWYLCREDRGPEVSAISDASQVNSLYLGLTALSPTILAVLLIISGIEQNPGPVVEVETTIPLSCTECGRNLKTGIQCDMCGHRFHYSCGNVKGDWAVRDKWNCDKCETEKVRLLHSLLCGW